MQFLIHTSFLLEIHLYVLRHGHRNLLVEREGHVTGIVFREDNGRGGSTDLLILVVEEADTKRSGEGCLVLDVYAEGLLPVV